MLLSISRARDRSIVPAYPYATVYVEFVFQCLLYIHCTALSAEAPLFPRTCHRDSSRPALCMIVAPACGDLMSVSLLNCPEQFPLLHNMLPCGWVLALSRQNI